MATTLFPIIFLAAVSLAGGSICYRDLNFTVSAWRTNSDWITKTSVQYSLSLGSSPTLPSNRKKIIPGFYNSAKEVSGGSLAVDQFPIHVDVDHCGDDCSGKPQMKITVAATNPESRGLAGYDYYPGVGYYKFHRQPTTWDNARKICNSEGTHLVVINSEEESRICADYLATMPELHGATWNDNAHIGLHNRFIQGEFITIFDQPLHETGFQRWFGADQPDNYKGIEFCCTVHRNGGLNDQDCDAKQPFICEQELC